MIVEGCLRENISRNQFAYLLGALTRLPGLPNIKFLLLRCHTSTNELSIEAGYFLNKGVTKESTRFFTSGGWPQGNNDSALSV